jgi:hypothetical protein
MTFMQSLHKILLQGIKNFYLAYDNFIIIMKFAGSCPDILKEKLLNDFKILHYVQNDRSALVQQCRQYVLVHKKGHKKKPCGLSFMYWYYLKYYIHPILILSLHANNSIDFVNMSE